MVKRWTPNPKIAGSSPAHPANLFQKSGTVSQKLGTSKKYIFCINKKYQYPEISLYFPIYPEISVPRNQEILNEIKSILSEK